MASLSFHDKQHLQRVLAQQQNITALFNRFIGTISPHLRKWTDTGNGSVWSRNGAIENIIDRELAKLEIELKNNISSFQTDAWKRSELKNDQMIREYLNGMSIRSQVKEGLFARNTDGMRALQGRIDKDMNLSTRVWNLADQTKTQLEFYLGSGISIGQSAANISQDIRQILNNPDARFHRIRNAEGKLVESKPMMNYNPGPGVYKSAYKNALRVAVTETNMAYRKADSDRWQKLDFVLGFEVKRSGNNKGGCVICDAMAGTYPKEFVFTGWHPFCICLATPILMNHDEFAEYLLNDTIPMDRYITEIPSKAVRCMEQYKYSFTRAPYQMKQNMKIFVDREKGENTGSVSHLVKGIKSPNKVSDKEVKAILAEFALRNSDLFYGKLSDIGISKGKYAMMKVGRYYDSDHRYIKAMGNKLDIHNYDFEVASGIYFNPLKEVKSALLSIRNESDLTFNQEYSLESLWHEIRHAGAKGWKDNRMADKYSSAAMETINQFCARKSYDQFIAKLGGKAVNQADVLSKGYGYANRLANFRSALECYGVSDNDAYTYFNNIIQEEPYEKIIDILADFFSQKGADGKSVVLDLMMPSKEFKKKYFKDE